MKPGEQDNTLLIVPFHDWRKIQMEGFRTRDSHFIEEISNRPGIKVIINRPTTYLEILLKRKLGLVKGKRILSKGRCSLYKLDKDLYLTDYISNDVLGQIFKKFSWFICRYGDNDYVDFISASLNCIGANDKTYLLNQNIFAFKLSEKLASKIKVFDAWDNFIKFQVYAGIQKQIEASYKSLAKSCDFWITNSIDNVGFFKREYQPREIHIINNGVDLKRFTSLTTFIPEDLASIPRPIAGFGGKITHLIDVSLLNKTLVMAKDVSFVFIGQILDKEIFQAIEKTNNFYYLGDKHYEKYPDYVKNFDVCLVPYVVDERRKSGANTIKVYEYLATGKKVIGTPSNGLEELKDNVYLVSNPDEFSYELKDLTNNKNKVDLLKHSWSKKVDSLLGLLKVNDK